MKITSLKIYSTTNPPRGKGGYKKIYQSEDGRSVYVRVEPSGRDFSDAFEYMHPRHGETVLNTIPI